MKQAAPSTAQAAQNPSIEENLFLRLLCGCGCTQIVMRIASNTSSTLTLLLLTTFSIGCASVQNISIAESPDDFNKKLHGKVADIFLDSTIIQQAKDLYLYSDTLQWSTEQRFQQINIRHVRQIRITSRGKGVGEGFVYGAMGGFVVAIARYSIKDGPGAGLAVFTLGPLYVPDPWIAMPFGGLIGYWLFPYSTFSLEPDTERLKSESVVLYHVDLLQDKASTVTIRIDNRTFTLSKTDVQPTIRRGKYALILPYSLYRELLNTK